LRNKQLFRQQKNSFALKTTVVACFTSQTSIKAVDYALQIGQLGFAKRDNKSSFQLTGEKWRQWRIKMQKRSWFDSVQFSDVSHVKRRLLFAGQ